MTEIRCKEDCKYSVLGICNRSNVEMCSGSCCDSDAYSAEDNPEYQSPYWIQVKNYEDNRFYRKERKGKRVEIGGLVFYTECDDRYSQDIPYTEEITGALAQGPITEEKIEKIKRKLKDTTPVMELPIYYENEPLDIAIDISE